MHATFDQSRNRNVEILHAEPSPEPARAWAAAHRATVLATLRDRGHLLLRGLPVEDPATFEAVVGELIDEWMNYRDRASKRSAVAGRVMTSTDTPRGFAIHQHCESSFTSRWPRRICFWCDLPAAQGGRTPITDMRGVTRELDPALIERFAREGVMYVRNFSADGTGVGMDWRDVFQVDTREELEHYCEDATIGVEWLEGGRLRTTQVRPALVKHPDTGERVWFNHTVALHASALDGQLLAGLLRQVGEAGLPHNVYFGSGAPIAPADIASIRAAHERNTITFDWQHGDVLLLDNVRSAHGREPYEGERRVCTLMANPHSWAACGHVLSLPQGKPRYGQWATPVHVPAASVPTEDPRDWFLAAVARELEVVATPSDNFEALGGDSLAAVALVDELFETFGIDLPIETMLEAATLADVIAQMKRGD